VVRVGILGASGYGGAELIRLLKGHPEVELVGFSSRKHVGKPLEAAWPQLWDGALFAPQEEVLEKAEVVFLALPNGLSMEIAPLALREGKKVVDLSGDFRLPPEVYGAWYGIPTKAPSFIRRRSTACPSSTGRRCGWPGSWPTRGAT
jgi:N-acetyl-gamma-glutamyl-phosphate reductase